MAQVVEGKYEDKKGVSRGGGGGGRRPRAKSLHWGVWIFVEQHYVKKHF